MQLVAIVRSPTKTHRFTLNAGATVSDVASALANEGREEIAKEDYRLIANGRELELGFALAELGEFFFMRNAIFLLPVDRRACREWQRTGRCTDRECQHKSTHDMAHSPRYVAHQLKAPSTEQCQQVPSPELRAAPEKCRNWCNTGKCRFGAACFFAASHTEECRPARPGIPIPGSCGARPCAEETLQQRTMEGAGHAHCSTGVATTRPVDPRGSVMAPAPSRPNAATSQAAALALSRPNAAMPTSQAPALSIHTVATPLTSQAPAPTATLTPTPPLLHHTGGCSKPVDPAHEACRPLLPVRTCEVANPLHTSMPAQTEPVLVQPAIAVTSTRRTAHTEWTVVAKPRQGQSPSPRLEPVIASKCCREGCEFFGSAAAGGLCSQHLRESRENEKPSENPSMSTTGKEGELGGPTAAEAVKEAPLQRKRRTRRKKKAGSQGTPVDTTPDELPATSTESVAAQQGGSAQEEQASAVRRASSAGLPGVPQPVNAISCEKPGPVRVPKATMGHCGAFLGILVFFAAATTHALASSLGHE